jgi:DNA topoisomerase-2
MSKTNGKKKDDPSDQYVKLEHKQHVLEKPGMYIGSIDNDFGIMHVYDDVKKKIIVKEMKYTPGFYKTFDEVLVNAFDHTTRVDANCKTIKVNISKESGMIKVWNDGTGIPVTIHSKEKIYIPELIFANLLTSQNYDKNDERVCSGTNGLGVKLCNIFSKSLVVETLDNIHGKKKYIQEYKNNMSIIGEPTISPIKSSEKSYTCVTYYPDFQKLNMTGLSNNDVAWMKKRVYDISVCTKKDVNVYLDDKEILTKTFQDYINICYDEKPTLIYNEVGERWKIGCVFAPDNGNHYVSFINGTSTYKGGTHVDYILDQITSYVAAEIKKKHNLTIKAILIKEHIDLYIDASIVNPDFSSQTKSELTSKVSKFGSECKLPKQFFDALLKTKLIELVVKNAQFKESTALSKTDGKKGSMIDVPKLEDARFAGTKKGSKCRLFLTEGDSAFAYFKAGLEKIGRDFYGGFPMRGKLLNVRNATVAKISNSAELYALKQILRLKQGVKYTSTDQLRYGGIIILTDQDSDGSHIKGLIINLFQHLWPDLLKIKGFIQTISTILVRAWKKTDKKKSDPMEFYSEVKFEDWAKTVDISKYDVKYYKGLGTSDDKTARKSFIDFENKIISFIWEEDGNIIEESFETKAPLFKSKKKLNDQDENNSDNDSDNDSNNDNNSNSDSENDNVSESDNVGSDKKVKGGAKVKKTKGKLNIEITDPTIVNSLSYKKIILAFDESLADQRKKWLSIYDKNIILDYDKREITYSEFIDKDLKHFSIDNIRRSIPSLVDGFKPSQRKIIHIILTDNIRKDIKVLDLASEVSKRTAYKHGNVSLEETIIKMAQEFTGSNNINLLYPNGNFGHRWVGGKDSASARYIFTFMENITPKIFIRQDESILNYLHEEGQKIEPDFYYPIIPMVLVNGCEGIGTGFSTSIPPYNPLDICDNLLNLMAKKQMDEMIPWIHGFRGTVEKELDNKTGKPYFRMTGIHSAREGNIIDVIELPVGTKQCFWPRDYEEKIMRPMAGLEFTIKDDKKEKKKKLTEKDKKKIEHDKKIKEQNEILNKYYNNCGNDNVNFELQFKQGEMQKLIKKGEIIDKLKLSAKISISNMYLFNTQNILTKYTSPLEILEEFYYFRLGIYSKRKKYYMELLGCELEILKYKVKYIKEVLNDDIHVSKRSKDDVIKQLETRKFPRLTKKVGALENEKSYDYLAGMLLWSLTLEKIDELNKEYDEKQAEYDDYNSTSEIDLWKREIIDFRESYKIWLKEKIERKKDDDDDKPKKKKK